MPTRSSAAWGSVVNMPAVSRGRTDGCVRRAPDRSWSADDRAVVTVALVDALAGRRALHQVRARARRGAALHRRDARWRAPPLPRLVARAVASRRPRGPPPSALAHATSRTRRD